MAVKSKDTLKSFFETGDTPSQSNFEDLIDSTFNTLTDSEQNELKSGNATALHKHTAANITVDDSSFSVQAGTNAQSVFDSIDNALLNARTTGVRYGGDISINDSDSNTFDVSELVGQILDNTDPTAPVFYSVTYTEKTGIAPANEGINYLYYLPGDDTLYQTLTAPTYEDRKTRMYIGRAVLRGGILAAIPQDKDYIQQMGLQLRELAEAIGQIKKSGLKITANGANLSFNSTQGVLFDFGANGQENPHEITIAAKTAATFQYVTQSASITTDRTTLDPNQYDLNGVLTAVASNRYTIQDVYFFSSGNVRISYGQNLYSSLADAKEALQNRIVTRNPGLSLGLDVASIIVKGGTTSLQSATDAYIYNWGKFGSGLF